MVRLAIENKDKEYYLLFLKSATKEDEQEILWISDLIACGIYGIASYKQIKREFLKDYKKVYTEKHLKTALEVIEKYEEDKRK